MIEARSSLRDVGIGFNIQDILPKKPGEGFGQGLIDIHADNFKNLLPSLIDIEEMMKYVYKLSEDKIIMVTHLYEDKFHAMIYDFSDHDKEYISGAIYIISAQDYNDNIIGWYYIFRTCIDPDALIQRFYPSTPLDYMYSDFSKKLTQLIKDDLKLNIVKTTDKSTYHSRSVYMEPIIYERVNVPSKTSFENFMKKIDSIAHKYPLQICFNARQNIKLKPKR